MHDSLNASTLSKVTPFDLEAYMSDLREIGYSLDGYGRSINVGEAIGEEQEAIFKRCYLGLDRVYAKYGITTESQRGEANGKVYAYYRQQTALENAAKRKLAIEKTNDPLIAAIRVAQTIDDNYPNDESLEHVWGEYCTQADALIFASKPSSRTGVIAGLEWMQKEIEQDMFTDSFATLLENCVEYLKAQ